MVNVAVAPVARVVVESGVVTKFVEVGCVRVTDPVPSFVIVIVCAAGCVYGVSRVSNDIEGGFALIIKVSSCVLNSADSADAEEVT